LVRSESTDPSIVNVFFSAGYAEACERGIERIYEDCNKYGISLPEYCVKTYEVIETFTGLMPVDQAKDAISF